MAGAGKRLSRDEMSEVWPKLVLENRNKMEEGW